MTELNAGAPVEAANPMAWPELPVDGFDGTGSAGNGEDGAVQAILERVREIPGLPVSEHPAAYTEMHDALLDALNNDISGTDISGADISGADAPSGSGAA